LDGASGENRLERFTDYHGKMKTYLKETDFEYMVWQEWKEGYARYVENLVREKLGMRKNASPLAPPFDRVCFYGIGSKYIELLVQTDDALKDDAGKLFHKMMA